MLADLRHPTFKHQHIMDPTLALEITTQQLHSMLELKQFQMCGNS